MKTVGFTSSRCVDYPLGIGPEHCPGGTVWLLEDLDGDGKIDRSTVFAEPQFPDLGRSVERRDLTAPPDVLFLKDTNGDGKATCAKLCSRFPARRDGQQRQRIALGIGQSQLAPMAATAASSIHRASRAIRGYPT
jgi:hypothetical protein